MNILIPHSWLLEHLETKATPEEIQKYLSLSGPSVERIYNTNGEPVYDIEVTTNRVDCMSVRGIAREAAVILTQAGIPSKLKDAEILPEFITDPILRKNKKFPLPEIVNGSNYCGRIMCMVLSDVKHVSSPDWMKARLEQIGVSVHDAIIDITNYVTHDLGHPCHVFDYDKVMTDRDSVMRIVKSYNNREFTALDGQTRRTKGGEIVIENRLQKIIDLPGIIGMANTAITPETKTVLLWIESIDPQYIRHASMSHSIRTVAASLNERGVDPELIPPVFAKAVELLKSLTNATSQDDTFLDLYPDKRNLEDVVMPLSRIDQYLGLHIEPKTTLDILESLGCSVRTENGELTLTPPSWRPDITIAEDVIEEIARIYGYQNLPGVLMSGEIPVNRPIGTNFALEHEVKALLANLGGYELYTYSLIDEKTASVESEFILKSLATEGDIATTHLKLKNPLTEDMVYLRRTLWASHFWILETHQPEFVFELANTYLPVLTDSVNHLPPEELHLTLSSQKDERHLKGILNSIVKTIYLPPVRFEPINAIETNIFAGEILIGKMLIIPNAKLTIIDLDWKTIVLTARKYPVVRSIPKVSHIIEDMTFSLTKPHFVQQIMDEIRKVDSLISRVEFKDQFKQNVSFTIYYQPEEEMNATQIVPYRKKIAETLAKNFGAKIVGKI